MKRRHRKSIRIRLPELSPREAAALSFLFDQLDLALWDLCGNRMTRLCEREGVPLLLIDSESEQTAVRKGGR